jgi:hypothetical protein
MTSITEMLAAGWENFTARGSGPMNLRFIMQPAMASLLAIRAGWKDAKAGRPAFLWGAVTNPAARAELLRSGWKDMSKAFLLAAVLDAVYQVVVHERISVIGMLFTATLLALVPYSALRGPVNRIARGFMGPRSGR